MQPVSGPPPSGAQRCLTPNPGLCAPCCLLTQFYQPCCLCHQKHLVLFRSLASALQKFKCYFARGFLSSAAFSSPLPHMNQLIPTGDSVRIPWKGYLDLSPFPAKTSLRALSPKYRRWNGCLLVYYIFSHTFLAFLYMRPRR